MQLLINNQRLARFTTLVDICNYLSQVYPALHYAVSKFGTLSTSRSLLKIESISDRFYIEKVGTKFHIWFINVTKPTVSETLHDLDEIIKTKLLSH